MSGGCIDSETPRPRDVTEAFQTLRMSEGAREGSYRIATAVTTPHGEGRMPGAAEDLRPGGLPKGACSSSGGGLTHRCAGRGSSPLGGEGRGNIAAPLPLDRRSRQ